MPFCFHRLHRQFPGILYIAALTNKTYSDKKPTGEGVGLLLGVSGVNGAISGLDPK
jgi:hypothetical protein